MIHTASPFILNAEDYEKDLFRPAIDGTLSVLRATQKYNDNVKRVVITSSFAANYDPSQGLHPGYTYTDADWAPFTRDGPVEGGAFVAYLASKTFAERAAWDYVEQEKVWS